MRSRPRRAPAPTATTTASRGCGSCGAARMRAVAWVAACRSRVQQSSRSRTEPCTCCVLRAGPPPGFESVRPAAAAAGGGADAAAEQLAGALKVHRLAAEGSASCGLLVLSVRSLALAFWCRACPAAVPRAGDPGAPDELLAHHCCCTQVSDEPPAGGRPRPLRCTACSPAQHAPPSSHRRRCLMSRRWTTPTCPSAPTAWWTTAPARSRPSPPTARCIPAVGGWAGGGPVGSPWLASLVAGSTTWCALADSTMCTSGGWQRCCKDGRRPRRRAWMPGQQGAGLRAPPACRSLARPASDAPPRCSQDVRGAGAEPGAAAGAVHRDEVRAALAHPGGGGAGSGGGPWRRAGAALARAGGARAGQGARWEAGAGVRRAGGAHQLACLASGAPTPGRHPPHPPSASARTKTGSPTPSSPAPPHPPSLPAGPDAAHDPGRALPQPDRAGAQRQRQDDLLHAGHAGPRGHAAAGAAGARRAAGKRPAGVGCRAPRGSAAAHPHLLEPAPHCRCSAPHPRCPRPAPLRLPRCAPQALCVCPTRELVVQNQMVLERMGKFTGGWVGC